MNRKSFFKSLLVAPFLSLPLFAKATTTEESKFRYFKYNHPDWGIQISEVRKQDVPYFFQSHQGRKHLKECSFEDYLSLPHKYIEYLVYPWKSENLVSNRSVIPSPVKL